MWARFTNTLCCPKCRGDLRLHALAQRTVQLADDVRRAARLRNIEAEDFDQYVDSGVLLCATCRAKFPIFDGLPVLLTYTAGIHREFVRRHPETEQDALSGYAFLEEQPASGERAVMDSFSTEWLDYDYDGVIWELSYDDQERRLVQEMGPALHGAGGRTFLEVGCGLGITTWLAHKQSGADAIGVDLSAAVWKACRQYSQNPFLHFVQASVFAMPFRPSTFDLVYSRGVLHHTVSTEKAFEGVAPLCKRGGTLYLWVYGTGSIRETMFRRIAYGLERICRPALSRAPNSVSAKAFLTAMGVGYVLFNAGRRMFNPAIQPLTLARGVHAARDRFTPRYAHRHDVNEVTSWFRRAGFMPTEVIDWRIMPVAEHDDYRRNVGVRGLFSGATR